MLSANPEERLYSDRGGGINKMKIANSLHDRRQTTAKEAEHAMVSQTVADSSVDNQVKREEGCSPGSLEDQPISVSFDNLETMGLRTINQNATSQSLVSKFAPKQRRRF